MKFRLIALAALASVAGQAFAVPDTTPVTAAQAAAATNALYISGSSAAKAIISGLVQQNCNTGSFVTFTESTGNYNAYACRALAANDWGLAENTIIVVNKRDNLGSGYGVFPVAYNTPIDFLNLASCPTNTTCGLAKHTPDAGISDEEPTLYNVPANRPADFVNSAAVKTSNFGVVTPVFSQVFGVAVTAKLYAALQAAQNTTGVPSLSSTYLANFFSQNVGAVGYLPLNVANSDAGVNVCFRDIGSGTRAAGNAFFGQYPGNTLSGFAPLDGAAATVTAPSDVNGDIYISEAGSGGGVQGCLQTVNGLGIGYGIGLLALGSGEVPANYKFVAIDGTVPSRDSAKNGGYGFWVESTIQTNKASTASPAAKAFLTQFIAKASYSTNLAQLSTTAQGGVFALPTSTSNVNADKCSTYAGTYPVGGTTPADKFCSRFTRSTNSSTIPAFYK
jgi:hypothetical protein